MIDSGGLKRIAIREGVPQAVVEKDVALSLALKCVSLSQLSEHLVFKGGTAIRKGYFERARFSEDLDFTASGAGRAKCLDVLREALERIETSGFRFEKVEDEGSRTGLKASVRFKGPLAYAQRIRFDISFRENLVKEPLRRPMLDPYGIGAAELMIMSLEEILAEKLHALGNRSAARDLYDVWFLMEKGVVIDRPMLVKKFAYYDEKFDTGKTVDNMRKCKESWTRDLGHLVRELPPYHPIEMVVENRLSEVVRES